MHLEALSDMPHFRGGQAELDACQRANSYFCGCQPVACQVCRCKDMRILFKTSPWVSGTVDLDRKGGRSCMMQRSKRSAVSAASHSLPGDHAFLIAGSIETLRVVPC